MKFTLSSTLHRSKLRLVFLALLLIYLGTASWHIFKPLPPGVSLVFPARTASEVDFLIDATWLDADGNQHQATEIFDRFFALIDQAERRIVIEMFLLNNFAGQTGSDHRALSGEVIDRLIQRQRQIPEIDILLVTDPFNRLYGGVQSPDLDRLQAAGITIIETDLNGLRDSNPLYSALWRICCQWFGNRAADGWLPNPVGGEPVTLRTYLNLLNFKANHRKSLVVDSGDDWVGLVTSGNLHDASSRHSNVAVSFRGRAALDLMEATLAVARFSDPRANILAVPAYHDAPATSDNAGTVQVLTESQIRTSALKIIQDAQDGERLDLAMFYLAHRQVIRALIKAHQRGVQLRVLLDPNEDAFGRKKNGVPNRQVAAELQAAGVPLRWCNTDGEQCHSKHLLHLAHTGLAQLLAGSSNFTRRNLDDYNLETQVLFQAPSDHEEIQQALAFFDRRWNNEPDRIHSLPYPAYADDSRLRYWRYRMMEATGLSTF